MVSLVTGCRAWETPVGRAVSSPAMLEFERRFVAALTTAADERLRGDVEAFVDATLRAMPEHLRAGVLAESIALATWSRLRYALLSDGDAMASLQLSLARSPIGLLRQYPRLFRSLVFFAEHELGPAA